MKQFRTARPLEVMTTEVQSPADPRGRQGQFDEAIAKEVQGLAKCGVYKVVPHQNCFEAEHRTDAGASSRQLWLPAVVTRCVPGIPSMCREADERGVN